jgi:integrase
MRHGFGSRFGPDIEAMLRLREALGMKRGWLEGPLAGFDRHCSGEHPDDTVLTRDLVVGWLEGANPDGALSREKMTAIRAFGKYLQSIGVDCFVLPGGWIKQKRTRPPHMFTDEEFRAFFAASDRLGPLEHDPLRGHTVPVILRLMLGCGLRPQEARRLKRGDVDLRGRVLTVKASKGNKDRRVPFDAAMAELLANYDALAELGRPGRAWFFQSWTGEPHRAAWLAHQYHRCQTLAGGVGPGSTPYTLRHNYAARTLARWVEEGEDLGRRLPYLSAYMGHASYRATAYYVHLLPARLAATGLNSIKAILPEAVG